VEDKLFSVADSVVLLSGASRGIGRELAAGFAQRGARVIITGRNEQTLAQTAQDISTVDSTVHAIVCDAADDQAIKRCVDEVLAEHGTIGTLVNVAGVNQRQAAESYSPEQFDFILDTNLRGAFLMSQEVGRHMITRRCGVQINIDSLNTYAPLKHVVPYAMSKAGMGMMTRGLALEWGQYGIRVNGIAPGFILTDLTRKLWSRPDMQAWNKQNTPLQRLGTVEDLVGAAIFLASPASAFMTGQTLRLDGGVSAGILWPI
jgi:NAD(P)-dependent dehydrogenase (short-subunit alcohol dehydrogenase family)